MDLLNRMLDLVLERSPEEVVGALFAALALALVMTGVYALTRRKAAEPWMLMIGLMVGANVASMALVAGYLHKQRGGAGRGVDWGQGRGPRGPVPPPGLVPPEFARHPAVPGVPPEPLPTLAARIVAAADADRDGRISPEEAAAAAGGFVREADGRTPGGVDAEALIQAVLRRFGPTPGVDPLPGAGPRVGSPTRGRRGLQAIGLRVDDLGDV